MKKIIEYFDAGYPLVCISTPEEQRVLQELKSLAKENKIVLYGAYPTQGIINITASSDTENTDDESAKTAGPVVVKKAHPQMGLNAVEMLDWVLGAKGTRDRSCPVVDEEWIVAVDYHPTFKNPLVWRKIKDVAAMLRSTFRRLIFLSIHFEIPPEISHEIVRIDVPLPSKNELRISLDNVVNSLESSAIEASREIELPEKDSEEYNSLLDAAKGMTTLEAEDAYALAFQLTQTIDPKVVMDEKVQVIKNSGILELYPATVGLKGVGGYSVLLKWLKARKRAFGEEARQYGLPMPKGMLMIGVSGCGKSLISKSVAAEWELPLIRLDAARLFGGVVGESESNVRRAIDLSEAVSPAVLWIDEIEKGLAMPQGQVLSGGEVTKHVVGTLCTWLSEKTSPIFVIATCNSIESLPPEMTRMRRWDQIFFVDLPTEQERLEIIKIVIGKYKRDVSKFECDTIASFSDGFSGSELEQAFIEGMTVAFSDASREVTTNDFLKAIGSITPISKTREEEIASLREWANGRAKWAGEREDKIKSRKVSRAVRVEKRKT